jgi:hypothetical protein
MILDPTKQVASIALARLVSEPSRLYHVHGSPSVQEPFTRRFQRIEDLCKTISLGL